MAQFRDDFDEDVLDPSVWVPHYLPEWSSRQATRASFNLDGSCLQLFLPTDAGLWCPGDHPEPLRVSGIQSGSHSGPVGSTRGQQRIFDGQTVKEEQPRTTGWLPTSGQVAIRCAMNISHRSMAALWLTGFEEHPDDSGELCVVEVFGSSLNEQSAEIGVGIKKLNDPRLTHDFHAPRVPIDVTAFHTYAVQWDDTSAAFTVDDEEIHRAPHPPTYPMQIMIAVFDFLHGAMATMPR